jgi:hypothetical protein
MTTQIPLHFVDDSADDGDEFNEPTTLNVDDPSYRTPASDQYEATHNSDPAVIENDRYKKRYDDLKSHYDETIGELKALRAEVKTLKEGNSAPKLEIPETEADLEIFLREYPDLARVMLKLSEKTVASQTTDLRKSLETLEDEKNKKIRQYGIEVFKAAHPDAGKIKKDQRFLDWFQKQPKKVQELVNSSDVEEAIEGLNLFKAHAGIAVSKATSKRDASAHIRMNNTKDPTPKSGRIWRESEIAAMSQHEYDTKFKAEITNARREGRILYDQSGRA